MNNINIPGFMLVLLYIFVPIKLDPIPLTKGKKSSSLF